MVNPNIEIDVAVDIIRRICEYVPYSFKENETDSNFVTIMLITDVTICTNINNIEFVATPEETRTIFIYMTIPFGYASRYKQEIERVCIVRSIVEFDIFYLRE